MCGDIPSFPPHIFRARCYPVTKVQATQEGLELNGLLSDTCISWWQFVGWECEQTDNNAEILSHGSKETGVRIKYTMYKQSQNQKLQWCHNIIIHNKLLVTVNTNKKQMGFRKKLREE
jgi:hypothetical protein